MSGRASIGEFEQLVLLATLRLDPEAYGVSILDEVRRHTGRTVLRPAVYVTLGRLEDKGLVRSEPRSVPGRGGRPRKYFAVSDAGIEMLRDARETLLAMWDGLEMVLDRR